jgi:hypothetical protein
MFQQQQQRGVFSFARDSAVHAWLSVRTGGKSEDPESCLFVNSSSSADATSSRVLRRDNLPPKSNPEALRFVVASDTHGRHASLGRLPPGDVFVHNGDILMTSRLLSPGGRVEQYQRFNEWLTTVPCATKVVIGGNHDAELEVMGLAQCSALFSNATYLANSRMEVATPSGKSSVLLYGSPASSGHSRNSAFQSKEFQAAAMQGAEEAAAAAAGAGAENRPEGAAVMVGSSNARAVVLLTHGCHGPSKHLREPFGAALKAHLWGHAHGRYGVKKNASGKAAFLSVCASIMDTSYCPTNLPVVFDLVV